MVLQGTLFPRIPFSVWFWVELAKREAVWDFRKQKWSRHHYCQRSSLVGGGERYTQTPAGSVRLTLPHCIQLSFLSACSASTSSPRAARRCCAVSTQRSRQEEPTILPRLLPQPPPGPIAAAGHAWVPDFPTSQGWLVTFLWFFSSPFQTFTCPAVPQII